MPPLKNNCQPQRRLRQQLFSLVDNFQSSFAVNVFLIIPPAESINKSSPKIDKNFTMVAIARQPVIFQKIVECRECMYLRFILDFDWPHLNV